MAAGPHKKLFICTPLDHIRYFQMRRLLLTHMPWAWWLKFILVPEAVHEI